MNCKKTLLIPSLLVASFASIALAQAGHEGMEMGGEKAAQSGMNSPFMTEIMAGMSSMHKDMSDMSKMNGTPDHDFLVMMQHHHKGAVSMSETYLKYGKDEKIKKLARSIIKDQKKEIVTMEKWTTESAGAKK